jgi:ribosome-associated translation inhibitor RaiA
MTTTLKLDTAAILRQLADELADAVCHVEAHDMYQALDRIIDKLNGYATGLQLAADSAHRLAEHISRN